MPPMPSPIRTGRKPSSATPATSASTPPWASTRIKAGRFAEAEQYLRKALERATDRYTSPKDGEPFYYLGLALKAQGKTDDAFERFAKATWSGAWRNAGYFEMAQIASLRGDFRTALTYANNSLNANGEDIRALALKSALLRHTGQTDAALATAAAIRKIDPLDVHALAEQWMAGKTSESAKLLRTACNAHPATALEVAADYLNAGLWQDGTTLLTQVVDGAADKSKVSPLVFYYLGYFAQKLNQPEQAAEYFQKAAQAPTDYVFPFQMEMISVLEAAMAANPERLPCSVLPRQPPLRLATRPRRRPLGEIGVPGRRFPRRLPQPRPHLHPPGRPAGQGLGRPRKSRVLRRQRHGLQ